MVRGKDVISALALLKFTPKKAAGIIKKSLDSAIANAENNLKQSKENLYIHTIYANEGPRLKRHIPVSRGRAHPIIKRMSHLQIELKIKAAQTETKKTAKPEATKPTIKSTTAAEVKKSSKKREVSEDSTSIRTSVENEKSPKTKP